MGLRKSASKLDLAKEQVKAAASDVATQAADARDRLAPTVAEARERVAPALADARDRVGPTVAEAKDRMAPAVAEAKDRLADLTETVATKLDESLPDDKTPDFVKDASSASRGPGRVKTVLGILGLGALIAFIASKRQAAKEPVWHSPTPGPAATSPTSTATTPAAQAADSAGGSPDEAAADAAESAHDPTTPEDPVEVVDIEDKR
jgi:hypothetical protein